MTQQADNGISIGYPTRFFAVFGAERQVSGAGNSRSEERAEAVSRRLQTLVRLSLLRRVARSPPRSCGRGGHRLLSVGAFVAQEVFDLTL